MLIFKNSFELQQTTDDISLVSQLTAAEYVVQFLCFDHSIGKL